MANPLHNSAPPASGATNMGSFNYAWTAKPAPAPPPFRKLVIVGGGSAGWMAAMIFAKAMLGRGVEITVLESPVVGIIGVGEGSTPWMKGFFDELGVEEAEWMPACNATYKCGIRFDGWSTKPGFESYFHPFACTLDNLTLGSFVHNADVRVKGADVHAHPNRFFVSAKLAEEGRAPKPNANFPFDIWHGYHFDSVLLGQFLHGKAVERGVRYRSCHVNEVKLAENGDIASVTLEGGESVAADFFVDCTGFASLLSQKALGTPFVAYADNLFNDAAIAMPTPMDERIPSQTYAIAMRHGWAWKIPLTSRYGNGYVYSTSFVSPDEAERELREHLGLLDSPVEARHLKMKTGRVTRHWHRNCLAVGLSQGFIEPLEATALLFIQRTATSFVEAFERGDLGEAAQAAYNERLNAQFEGTRDYIVTHYKANSRTDTDYWRANSHNDKLSDPLQALLRQWLSGRGIANDVGNQKLGAGYPIFSWYSILAGMGIFPDARELRPPTAREAAYRMQELDNLIGRSASNFREHKEVLQAIPPTPVDRPLQLYFW
jgi:2-polyprenyl-6-methoxyphenol hydroxylase-like FAD-dependent oxidoreductase